MSYPNPIPGLLNIIETKVKAASTAAGAVSLALYLLQAYVFHTAVPDIVVALVNTLIPAGLTFLAGYLARHTYRGNDNPPAAQ